MSGAKTTNPAEVEPPMTALRNAGLDILPTAFGTVAIVTRAAYQGQGQAHPLSGTTYRSTRAALAAFRASL